MTIDDIAYMTPEGMERRELVTAIPKIIVSLGEITSKAGDNVVFESLGLSTIKFILMHILSIRETSPTMTELRKEMLRSPANLTRLVDDLEANGWIQRVASPTDRRVKLIELTEAGHAKIAEAEQVLSERMMEFFAEYSDEETATLFAMLTRFGNEMLQLLGLEGDSSFTSGS